MAAELGILSLTHLQNLSQFQDQNQPNNPSSNPGAWMWNPKQATQEDGDDSWEVKAFEQDTGNIMGTTWPPRSYTCTFCRREFRSAQALGGHMNVHRRDRARLHQTQPSAAAASSSVNPNINSSNSSNSSSTLVIPTQEFATNGGLCLFYQLPNPSGVFTNMNACIDSPSTLLSISPYPPHNSLNFPVTPPRINSSHRYSSELPEPGSSTTDNISNDANNFKDSAMEELDLELRLGHRPTSS